MRVMSGAHGIAETNVEWSRGGIAGVALPWCVIVVGVVVPWNCCGVVGVVVLWRC